MELDLPSPVNIMWWWPRSGRGREAGPEVCGWRAQLPPLSGNCGSGRSVELVLGGGSRIVVQGTWDVEELAGTQLAFELVYMSRLWHRLLELPLPNAPEAWGHPCPCGQMPSAETDVCSSCSSAADTRDAAGGGGGGAGGQAVSSGGGATRPPRNGGAGIARFICDPADGGGAADVVGGNGLASLSLDEFVEQMHVNTPVIIEGVTTGWKACSDWVSGDADGSGRDTRDPMPPGSGHSSHHAGAVNLQFLEEHFGSSQVSVADTAPRHAGAGPCTQMTLAQFLDWWRLREAAQGSSNTSRSDGSSCADGGGGNLYVKDYHLASEYPEYKAYTCPAYFSDDWLNMFCDHKQRQQAQQQAEQQREQQRESFGDSALGPRGNAATSDYRFVYLGPAGSSTPLHADVLCSFSWSAQVAGSKLWRLLPPAFTHLLQDRYGRGLAHSFFADQVSPGAAEQYPRLKEARQHMLEVVQQPGSAIFVSDCAACLPSLCMLGLCPTLGLPNLHCQSRAWPPPCLLPPQASVLHVDDAGAKRVAPHSGQPERGRGAVHQPQLDQRAQHPLGVGPAESRIPRGSSCH